MDQEKLDKMIKENKGILRQLTDLNNRVKELEEMPTIEEIGERFRRVGFEIIEGTGVMEKDIPKIKIGGTD